MDDSAVQQGVVNQYSDLEQYGIELYGSSERKALEVVHFQSILMGGPACVRKHKLET